MQWFLLNEICTDTHLLDCCGTDSSRKFCGNLDGKKYRLGNVYFFTKKHGLCLSGNVEWYENGCEEADHGSHVAEIDETLLVLQEPTSFLDHVYLGCTQRERKSNKIIINQYRQLFESRISAAATDQVPGWVKRSGGPTTWKDMRKSALRGVANWQVRRQSNCTESEPLGWPQVPGGGTGNSWSIVKCMLSGCLEVLVFGKSWETRHLMICEQTYSICHKKKDKSLWQTFSLFDCLFTSQK